MENQTPLEIARAHVREAEALVAAQRVVLVTAIREKTGVKEAEALLRILEESLAGYRRELVALK